jgi:hypothetical protein
MPEAAFAFRILRDNRPTGAKGKAISGKFWIGHVISGPYFRVMHRVDQGRDASGGSIFAKMKIIA